MSGEVAVGSDGALARGQSARLPRRLQRGVSDANLNEFEVRFGLKLPVALRELYRWRNGQEDGCYDSLQLNRMFTPLEDVADFKDMLDGMIGTDFKHEGWWRRG